MHRAGHLVPLIICLLATISWSAEAEPIATTRPAGDYQAAWLRLEQGAIDFAEKKRPAIDVSLYLGFRDAQCVVAWFAHLSLAGARIVWLDRSLLQLAGDTLQGELAGRTNLNWGEKNVHDYVYSFDATIRDEKISGTFTASFADDAGVKAELHGKLSGDLHSAAALHQANGLPADKNWPHYYGDGYGFAGPSTDAKLIEHLALAKPVWKSEAFIPTAYGSAPDSRYFDRAGRTGSGGGSSSPVVVDGRVYQFFYQPRGPVGLDKAYAKYETESDLQKIARELFPKREVQQQAVLNHFRTQADEVLVCLDTASGQTLWKTTFPQRGNNYQTHKHRGHFPVALVSGGVVYQPGTSGRLYALDAATGKLQWEYPSAHPEPYVTSRGDVDCNAPSPVLVGDVVAYAASGKVIGVDANSGQKKWEQPLWHRTSLLPWTSGNKALLIASDRNHEKKENYAVALDPVDGRVVWREPVEYLNDFAFPLLAGDLLIGYSVKAEYVKPGENDGLAVIHAYKLAPAGLTKAWTTKPLAPIVDTVGLAIANEHLFVSAAREAFCLKLATGETVAMVENVGGARTQTAFTANGRLLIQPEGRHGRQSFFMLDADPKRFRAFTPAGESGLIGKLVDAEPQWLPPHSWTTAYANQPIVYPLVDGRLFVRGLDAIYCYDLRQSDAGN